MGGKGGGGGRGRKEGRVSECVCVCVRERERERLGGEAGDKGLLVLATRKDGLVGQQPVQHPDLPSYVIIMIIIITINIIVCL